MEVVGDLALVRLGDGGGRRNCLAGGILPESAYLYFYEAFTLN